MLEIMSSFHRILGTRTAVGCMRASHDTRASPHKTSNAGCFSSRLRGSLLPAACACLDWGFVRLLADDE